MTVNSKPILFSSCMFDLKYYYIYQIFSLIYWCEMSMFQLKKSYNCEGKNNSNIENSIWIGETNVYNGMKIK